MFHPIASLFDYLKQHGDAASGAVLGASTSSVIASTPPHPELWVEALRWVGAGCLSLLPIVVTRVLVYREARASRLAEEKRRMAAILRGDNNPDNDERADRLELEAAEHAADAAGNAAARATRGKGHE
jgi:hypothetical protein